MDPTALPGGDLVEAGLRDLERGVESIPALLVAIGAPRLARLGLPAPLGRIASPERRLYDRLAAHDPDAAHSRYNALVRRLVSFERAAGLVIFAEIEPELFRFPAVDARSFRRAVEERTAGD